MVNSIMGNSLHYMKILPKILAVIVISPNHITLGNEGKIRMPMGVLYNQSVGQLG